MLSSTSTCVNAVSNAEAFITSQLPGLLDTTLRTIRAHAPAAKIVVLGYPDLYDLSKSSTCIGLSTRTVPRSTEARTIWTAPCTRRR